MKNARMNEFTDSSYRAYSGMYFFVRKEQDEHSKWWSGTVTHDLGIARWHMSHYFGGDRDFRELTIEFTIDGKTYRRNWNAWYGLKTITRLANEFIEEICGGEE